MKDGTPTGGGRSVIGVAHHLGNVDGAPIAEHAASVPVHLPPGVADLRPRLAAKAALDQAPAHEKWRVRAVRELALRLRVERDQAIELRVRRFAVGIGMGEALGRQVAELALCELTGHCVARLR